MASINKREYRSKKGKTKGKNNNKGNNVETGNYTVVDSDGNIAHIDNGNIRASDAKNADFHVHAKDHSDGVLTLPGIIKRCNSISWISWLQHNTLSSWENFIKQNHGDATRPLFCVRNISMVPAVEITCRDTDNTNTNGNPVKVHVLAYAPFLTEDSPLLRLLRIKSDNDKLVDYGVLKYVLRANGILVDEGTIKDFVLEKREEDRGFNTFGTKSCMEFFEKSKLPLAKSEREVEKILDSVPRIERLNLELKDVLKIIHASGGLAVLAHPMVNLKRSNTPEKTLENFFLYDGDGLELISPCMDQQSFSFLMGEVAKIQRKNDTIYTGGSDTHIPSKDASLGRFSGKYISCDSQRGMIREICKLKNARDEGVRSHRLYSEIPDEEVEEIIRKYEDKGNELKGAYNKNKSLHDGSEDKIVVSSRIIIRGGEEYNPETFGNYRDYLRLTKCFSNGKEKEY